MENPARVIARIFINVFGITQPTPKEEDRATNFIMALIVFVAVFFALASYFFFHGFRA